MTYRKGAVSSARFTPDGQSFVYSASWDGQPYASFLGRAGEPRCARSAVERLADHVCLARAGEMAVAFGPQNIAHTFGDRVLSRIPWPVGHDATCS